MMETAQGSFDARHEIEIWIVEVELVCQAVQDGCIALRLSPQRYDGEHNK